VIVAPWWSTACEDWEQRIVEGRSLIPIAPLFTAQAEAALERFKSLRLVDVANRPTMGESCKPWATDLAGAIFGAYDPETGIRWINDFHLDIAKKNIKSTLAAGVMLTALSINWRESGEFYILAPTKEIADNSFFPARDMVNADEELKALMHVQPNFRMITHRKTGAFLKVVAADSETVGGKKTIGLFIDELWLFGKRANAEPMIREAKGGLASRPEGFVISASTKPDAPPAGVYAQRLEYFRAVRDGRISDPRSLGVLYEYPKRFIESGDYKKREYFYIPNPNLNVSVSEQYLVDEMAKAQHAGRSSLINFFAKHLNVEPGMAERSDSWAGVLVWERGIDKTLTLDALLDRCEVVTVGIDGGGLDDLLGIAVIGREKVTKRWLGWAHAMISDVGIERRKANIVDYDKFEQQGDLTKFIYVKPEDVTKIGTPINIRYCVDLVKKIKDRGLLGGVGVDRIGIGAIVDALAEIGVTQEGDDHELDSVSQGIALMGAIKTLEIKLADYSFCHCGSDMLAWCVGNLRVVATRTAMMVARDEAGFGKVDPFMALADAAQLMSLNPTVAAGGSYLDREPLLVL
jgi:phage terminase large subunit-like protein